MLTIFANHLWQSTLFALVAGLLTLALRNNPARTRHTLWMIASVKFLLPFSLLVTAASHISWRTAPAASQVPIPTVLDAISQPFQHATSPAVAPALNVWPAIVLALWICGCGLVVLRWVTRWYRIRTAVRLSTPVNIDAPVSIRSSPALLEPGVFGIFRPVLLLPERITDHLTPAQLDAVLAHELCHVRRRDNLAATIHMVVESIFWFHPLVWWIGTRLVEERERACDEEVIRCGSNPQDYAESILKVCQFYLESPLVCVSGITGANLKSRIENIMTREISRKLNPAKKVLLAVMGIAAIVGPLAIGLMNAPPIRAQSSADHARLEFEAAVIKPNQSVTNGTSATHDAGGLTATNGSLQSLIQMAYGVKRYQLSGAPGWLNSERFDIVAKAPPNSKREQMLPMLQSLIEDRFKLAFHRETKMLSGYALVVASSGPKLHESKADEGMTNGFPGSLIAKRITIPQLAGTLARWFDRPISDMTGLQGFYDIELKWAPEERETMKPAEGGPVATAPADGPTIFTALQEQLGLKLESRKVPVEILVIDHVERTPTEN